jgi:hypothetical protein
VVEDDGYDPKKAVLAAQKLVNQDKVFLIASHIGTPMNNAAMPVMFEKGVINFFPLSAGREMYDPANKLKFASVASYYDTMRMNVARLYKEKGAKNACVLGSTYYFYSDGSINTTGTLTAAQTAAGITVVGNSGAVTAANFLSLCGSASATSPLYPTSRTWTATQKDKTTSFGFGVKHDFGKAKLDVNYNYTRGRTAVAYTYNAAALGLVTSGAPTAAQLTTLALIGSGFPDLVFRQDLVDASVLVPVNKTTAVRLLLRHEVGKFNDWHYDGVAANPTPAANQQTYLDAGPQDYKTTAVGAFVQFSW